MWDILGTIGEHDIAYSWIKQLFADEPGKPLSAAFAVFTSTLTFLGSLLMGWHIIIGIVSSAYSGKVLGERWHQIWAPLRVVLGFGMLVPVGGGFSAVHFLLRDVVGVAAVNLGNAPIVAYISAATNRENVAAMRTTYGGSLAREFLTREICFGVINAMNSQSVGRTVRGNPRIQRPTTSESASYFSSSVQQWDYRQCGKVSLTNAVAEDSEMFKSSAKLMSDFNTSRLAATNEMLTSIQNQSFFNFEKIGTLLATNGGWSADASSSDETINMLISQGMMKATAIADIKAIADTWNDKVSVAAQAVFKTASEQNGARLKERILTYGFMVAGSYERSLSAVSGMAVALASQSATVEKINLSAKYMEQVNKALGLVAGLQAQDTGLALAAGLAEPSGDSDWIPWLMSKIFPKNLVDVKYGTPSDDPIGDMITFGHLLLNTAAVAIGFLIAGAFTTAVPSAVSQSGMNAFGYAASWISWILVTFIVLGFLYSFLLPMLPMIMVFVMGVSWLVLYLEAAIAGVMWSFAFIRMDGSEFFDKNQAPGVALLFNLLLRPALGMLAFCGMLLLQPVLLRSLTLIWDQSFAAQTGSNGFSLVSMWQFVAGLILYSYLQWHLTIRLVSLIPQIPDKIGHWMGMQMSSSNDGHEIGGAATAMVGAGMAVGRAPFAQMAGDIQNVQNQKAKAKEEQARRSEAMQGRNGGIPGGGDEGGSGGNDDQGGGSANGGNSTTGGNSNGGSDRGGSAGGGSQSSHNGGARSGVTNLPPRPDERDPDKN
jgi:conjugal transfer/type IV secretion protein DotA/TraY